MIRNGASITIDRPAVEVFPWLIEPDRMTSWISGYTGSRPLTEGGRQVGARSIDTWEHNGRQHELETEVAAFEPPNYIALRFTYPNHFEARVVFSLSDESGITVVHVIQEVTVRTLIARLMSGILRRRVQKLAEADLARLKALVEAT